MLTDTPLEGVHLVGLVTALAAVGLVAYLVAELVARMARALLVGLLSGGAPGAPAAGFASPIVRRPIRIVRIAAFLATAAALALPALDMAGVDNAVGRSTVLREWLLGSGLRIVVITTFAYLLVRVIAASARRLEARIGRDDTPDMLEHLKRARTISRLVQSLLTTIVVTIAVLMVLQELHVDIMPILTGAGIAGLAVGFGAQTLVKDLIAGFFLTFENQVRVGDVANINGTGGLVEAINLRTIVLRDLEGTVHVFPNGSVERLANLTKDFSFYLIDVGVAYKEDTDRVTAVLRAVGADLMADPRYAASILEPLEVLGVDAFGESEVVIKVRIKTRPLKQWEVGRELRRRIKKAFDAEGIEIPFPHRSIYFGEASKPIVVRELSNAENAPAGR